MLGILTLLNRDENRNIVDKSEEPANPPTITREEFDRLSKLSDTELRDRRRAKDEEYRRKDWGKVKRFFYRNSKMQYIETAESQWEHLRLMEELGYSPEQIRKAINKLVSNAR